MRVFGFMALLQIGLVSVAFARECPGLAQDTVLSISGNVVGTDQAKLVEFTREDILALGTKRAVMERPWADTPAVFEGPLLAELVSASGVAGKNISIRAENNYSAEISIEQANSFSAIVEMNLDGQRYKMRESGPLFFLHPIVERSDNGVEDFQSYSIWKVCRITIH